MKKRIISTIAAIIGVMLFFNALAIEAHAVDYTITDISIAAPQEVTLGDDIGSYREAFKNASNIVLSTLAATSDPIEYTYKVNKGTETVSRGYFRKGITYNLVVSIELKPALDGTRTDNKFNENVVVNNGWTVVVDDEGKKATLTHRIEVGSSSSDSHVHEYVEDVVYGPTIERDGLIRTYCKHCGYVLEERGMSAFEYALNEYATTLINNAKPGQTITLEFGTWNSFPKWFMERLAARRDVTFVFKYKWNNELQTITIPAGAEVNLDFKWNGPAKMRELYGQYK